MKKGDEAMGQCQHRGSEKVAPGSVEGQAGWGLE